MACVALSGCGAEETASPSADTTKATPKAITKAAPIAASPAVWAFEYHGATGHVLIPVPLTDPRLAEIDGYRKRARTEPYFYAIVEVDNTHGTEHLYMAGVDTDAPGDEYTAIDEWLTLWEKNRGGGNKGLGPHDPVVKLHHPYDKLDYAPGQKGTVVFAAFAYGEKRPGPISKVTVATDVDFGAGVQATKVPTSATP